MSQKNKLDFSEFFPTAISEWKEKILKELNVKSEEELKWNNHGILFSRVNTSEDSLPESIHSLHDHFKVKAPRHWYNREYIKVKNPEAANKKALEALNKGADAVEFNLPDHNLSELEVNSLLNNIYFQFSPVHFTIQTPLKEFAKSIAIKDREEFKGSISHSIFELHRNAVFYADKFKELTETLKIIEGIPHLKLISVETKELHKQSLGPDYEIAYAIGTAIDLFDKLDEMQLSTKELFSRLEFSFSVGNNFITEIAKLRAFRLLWNKVVATIDQETDTFSIPLHCRTASHFYIEDIHTNILHNTTQAMAAAIGGCDSLTILPFDINQKKENPFSSRISRNISLLMQDEAYMMAVTDPAGGSYTIDQMTYQIAEKSLELLQKIEKKGGLSKAITSLA